MEKKKNKKQKLKNFKMDKCFTGFVFSPFNYIEKT